MFNVIQGLAVNSNRYRIRTEYSPLNRIVNNASDTRCSAIAENTLQGAL